VGGAVHLAGELAGRIEVVRQADRRLLVDHAVAGVSVYPDRAPVDDPGACGPGRLEDGDGPPGIALLGGDRLLRDHAHAGVGRQVHDRIAVLHRSPEGVAVEQVTDGGVHRPGLVVRRGPQVVDARLEAGHGELVHHMGTDEAGPARYQDPTHRVAPPIAG